MSHIHRSRRFPASPRPEATGRTGQPPLPARSHPVLNEGTPRATIRRRLGVIVALGALLGMFAGVLSASPALAGRGPKWQLVQANPFTLPAAYCGFMVRVTFPVNNQYSKLLKASDGSTIELNTGSLTSTYTNLSTGKAVTVNESGPGKVTTHADGSITIAGRGHSGLSLTPADAQRFGLPTVSVLTGAFAASLAADGTITSLSLNGHVLVDVCTALS